MSPSASPARHGGGDGVRAVLLLCWRDTGHPQGGGSETYLQRIGARLAADGVRVTLRTARHPGAPRREVVDGVHVSRGGGPYGVYVLAGLAMLAARVGRGPLRDARPDVVVDTQNGIPFFARLVAGRPTVLLTHHCHREQWPVAGPLLRWVGWWVESWLSPRAHRRTQYVTVSLPSARELIDLGVDRRRIAVVRNGLDPLPTVPVGATDPHDALPAEDPRLVVLSRLVPHKQIEDALAVLAALAPTHPRLRLDVVGGGWWHDRLTARAAALGVTARVTFHGHVDDRTKHALLARGWVHLLPSRKEGWALAVLEAAQHGVPSIGYRSSGGLTDSIVDGVTGLLVDDVAGLTAAADRVLGDAVLRGELGAKARGRSGEYSWDRSAAAMRRVLDTVVVGDHTSGVVTGPV